MLIQGHRIRSLDRHFTAVPPGSTVVLSISDLDRHRHKLRQVGFTDDLEPGESVLPPASIGPVSKRNANGWYIVHRDRPMETAFRMIEWRWREWRGRYDYEEKSDFRDVPYQRYPRTEVPPPSVELEIVTTTSGQKLVAVDPFTISFTAQEEALHRVNLLLEIFGECEIRTRDLQAIVRAPIRRLNWQLLPPGRHPWRSLSTQLNPIINRAPHGNQTIIRDRLETINGYGPEFVAIGRAGFAGYVVFGFPHRSLFLLESIHHGNATYVFGNDWERLSQLTKAEVLNNGLQRDRIIHLVGWHNEVRRTLS